MTPRPGALGVTCIEPGLYVVWRRIEKDGALHYREVVCRNPAYGYREIAEWQAQVRRGVQPQRAAPRNVKRDRLTIKSD